jgi:hypothetical protein
MAAHKNVSQRIKFHWKRERHCFLAGHESRLIGNRRPVLQLIHFHVFDFAYGETVCPEEIMQGYNQDTATDL